MESINRNLSSVLVEAEQTLILDFQFVEMLSIEVCPKCSHFLFKDIKDVAK